MPGEGDVRVSEAFPIPSVSGPRQGTLGGQRPGAAPRTWEESLSPPEGAVQWPHCNWSISELSGLRTRHAPCSCPGPRG